MDKVVEKKEEGKAFAKFVVEPAISNRSKCRTCKATIEKGALRFGTRQPLRDGRFDQGHYMVFWQHVACVPSFPSRGVETKV